MTGRERTAAAVRAAAMKRLQTLSRRTVFCRKRWAHYRTRAKRKELEFNLERHEFIDLLDAPCVYCGVDTANGVDRVDSRQGYIRGNVTSCCVICNRAKMSMGYDDFMAYRRRVAARVITFDWGLCRCHK